MRITLFLTLFFFMIIGSGSLSAQAIAHTADFESLPAGTITSTSQLPGWAVLASVAASATPDPNDDHCNLPTCCWTLSPNSSELINAPNGYSDPTIGSYYTIYSVFGSSPTPAAAALANPQISFPMGGSKFFRVGQPLGSGINRLTAAIPVTDSTSFIDIAYISVINRAHTCCADPGFRIEIDQATPCGTVLTNDCNNPQSVAGYFDVLTGGPAGLIFPHIFSTWRVKRYDLTPYMGTTVTIQISVYSCVFGLGPHEGYGYIDARCGSSAVLFNGVGQLTYQTKKTLISCQPSYTISAPPFYASYAWTGPSGFSSTQQSFTNSVSGTYTLVMGQDNNCSSVTRTIEVFVVPPVTITQSNTLCPGGSVLLTASGVSTYTWLNTNTSGNTLMVSPPVSTTYTVLAADTNGCIFKEEFHLLMNNPPVMNVVYTPSVCLLQSISLLATGADNYVWMSSSFPGLSYAAQATFTANIPGLLTFTVVGALNTCTAQTSVNVNVLPLPNANISVSPSDTVCAGQLVQLNGPGGFYYEWTGPGFITYTNSLINYSPQHAVSFFLTVTDLNGCKASATKTIHIYSRTLSYLDGKTKACTPFQAQVDIKSKPAAKSMEWFYSSQKSTGMTFRYVFNVPGTYTVKAVLTDSLHECRDTSLFYFVAYPKPRVDFTYKPEKVHEGDDIELTNLSDENVLGCQWYFGELETINSCEKVISYFFNDTGRYPLVLTAKNEFDCRDTAIKILEILPEFFLYVPNAFTPNNDGLNDVFVPVSRGVTQYSMEIFDRWGERLFVSKELQAGWNGSFKGKLCPVDVYVWKITCSTSYGEAKTVTGHVTLLGEN